MQWAPSTNLSHDTPIATLPAWLKGSGFVRSGVELRGLSTPRWSQKKEPTVILGSKDKLFWNWFQQFWTNNLMGLTSFLKWVNLYTWYQSGIAAMAPMNGTAPWSKIESVTGEHFQHRAIQSLWSGQPRSGEAHRYRTLECLLQCLNSKFLITIHSTLSCMLISKDILVLYIT